jgi:hypothetical protein
MWIRKMPIGKTTMPSPKASNGAHCLDSSLSLPLPVTERVKKKNVTCSSFVSKCENSARGLERQTESFLAAFENIVPAASLQGDVAMTDLDDTDTNARAFANFKLLDSNLTPLGRGNAQDFPQNTRDRTLFFCFTITVHPCLINPESLP